MGQAALEGFSFDDFLDACRQHPPRVALVLGSGLAGLANTFTAECSLPFAQVPGLAVTTVAGHSGVLALGAWNGCQTLVYSGRLHYYEGHPWMQVEQPVTLARELGAEVLVLTNAAGGIREDLVPGSLMALTHVLDWTRGVPGERFSPFSAVLLRKLAAAAAGAEVPLATGTYAQVTGPCYETCAEIRALQALGADAVGMSTGRESERGQALGMQCAAISCICNRAAGLSDGPIHHEEVLEMGKHARFRLARLLNKFLEGFA